MTAPHTSAREHLESRMADQDITTIEALHEQLHKAIQLEHATIPPYLTALYSIKPGCNFDCSLILREVAVEEMLHLTIAANLLNAVGGKPDLARRGFVPRYPAPLPDGEDDFKVDLAPFSDKLVDDFMKIERPAMAPTGKEKMPAKSADHATSLSYAPPGQPELRYYSIGEFYEAISKGIEYLEDQAKSSGKTIFTGNPAFQAGQEAYYSGGGKLPKVTDLKTARAAISQVIEQGEGKPSHIYDHTDELAHYYRFDQIKRKRKYLPGDEPGKPSGLTFDIDYDAVYPVKPNIRLTDFPPDSELLRAANSFNQAYEEFLGFLTKAFNGKPELLIDAVPKMFKFRNWLNILVRNPLPGTNYHAAPTFEIGQNRPEGKK
jgi:hypothetical protein